MKASVIICAYSLDRWGDLCQAVASCLNQSRMPDEMVVVVDHNDDLLQRAIAMFPSTSVVPNQFSKGLSGARNTGLASTSGDVVVFLDDDAVAEREWLERMIAPFSSGSVAGVGGWIVPSWPGDPPPWFPETFLWVVGCSYRGLPGDGERIRNPIGASMALRRVVFDTVGDFTSQLGRTSNNAQGGEETELCIRYVKRVPEAHFILARSSIVHHRVPAERLSWRYFRRRCWAEGLTKASVSSLVGSKRALAAERSHLATELPREVLNSVLGLARNPVAMIQRLGLIVVGATTAGCGFVVGMYSARRVG